MEQSGHTIILAAHIDDFVIVCADRTTLDKFSTRLLDVFDGTYEGAIHTYLGCEIERDLIAGTTTLSQRHYAEDILRTYGAHTEPGIVFFGMSRKVLSFIVVGFLSMNDNSLSTILTFIMTRLDLAFPYSELSKDVQCPQPSHMSVSEHSRHCTYHLGINYHP